MRINAPNSVAPFVFRSVIGPLIAKNPDLQLEIVATDRLVDVVEEGFDAGIRLGESLRNDMTAVKIRPRLRFAVVGSTSYFEHHPLPKTPDDLRHHVCIRNIYPSGKPYAWEFSRAGKIIEFEPTGSLSLDDHELMVEAALSGVGLAYVCEERARPYIHEGKLVECLASWSAPEDWRYLYYRRGNTCRLACAPSSMRCASEAASDDFLLIDTKVSKVTSARKQPYDHAINEDPNLRRKMPAASARSG